MLETPFLDWVSRYMALNHRRSAQLAGREDRSRRDRCLFAAGITLVQHQGAAFDDAVFLAVAVGTRKTLRPRHFTSAV